MKHIQKLIFMLLAVAMVLSMATTAFAAGDFSDVPPSLWCYEAVDYAVASGITTGIGNGMFGPDYTCTRGQVVTFLWRAQGCPEPKGSTNPFSDVTESDFFYKAVLWAVENGVTSGTSATTFSPEQGCTRGQVATFLWRSKGCPEPTLTINPFYDVPPDAYFYKPVLWAVAGCVTNGVSDTNFAPDNTCTRGQIVTFLYRCSGNYVPPKPAVPPVAASDRFEIAATACSINSAEGVDVTIYWRNNTGKTLADITFYMNFYDYNGNMLFCDIWDSPEFQGYILNPPFPSGVSENIYFSYDIDGTPHRQTLNYNSSYNEYYYYDASVEWNSPNRTVYVSPENINHTYNATYWESTIYNGRTQSVGISKVVLLYTDNTTEVIEWPYIGTRSDPIKDRIYTQQMYTRLGCGVVGHTAYPTCTESVLCSRCCNILPATGHYYSGYYDVRCENCNSDFVVDVDMYAESIQDRIDRFTPDGEDYSCTITGWSWRNEDAAAQFGIPFITGDLKINYEYISDDYVSISNPETIYLNVLDKDKNVIKSYQGTAYDSSYSNYVTFDVTLPENGTYYLDISFDNHQEEDCAVVGHTTKATCTESAVCSRCETTLPATGHSYNYHGACTNCNHIDCAIAGHDTEATCTESAVCSRCETTIPATGHSYYSYGECRNCGYEFTLDVILAQGNIQSEENRISTNGQPYRFAIENISYYDPELIIVDNTPMADYTIMVNHNYESDDYISYLYINEETIYLNIYDSERNLIGSYEEIADYSSYYGYYTYFYDVYLPGEGVYTYDISFSNE